MKQGIWDRHHIGDPVFDGLTFGGILELDGLDGGVFTKADFPGLRAIRTTDGSVILTRDLADSYTPPALPLVPSSTPRGVLGYAEIASNQGPVTTETDLTGLSVTVTTEADRRIKVTGRAEVQTVGSGAAGTVATTGRIREGSTELGGFHRYTSPSSTATTQALGFGSAIVAPAAGSHTYKLTLAAAVSTAATINGGGRPHFILVEDIGSTAAPVAAGADFLELWY